MGNAIVWIVWFAAAFACLGSAIAVVSFQNPFFSALALIGNLGSLAVLYLLLSAELQRRAAPRSISQRRSRSSSPGTTPSTPACAGASSRWRSTST